MVFLSSHPGLCGLHMARAERFWARCRPLVNLLFIINETGLEFLRRVESSIMSIDQIEEAIQKLPATEREALESRLIARRCGLDALSENERAELLSSLDEAEREIDEGRTYNGDQLRQAVRSWLGK